MGPGQRRWSRSGTRPAISGSEGDLGLAARCDDAVAIWGNAHAEGARRGFIACGFELRNADVTHVDAGHWQAGRWVDDFDRAGTGMDLAIEVDRTGVGESCAAGQAKPDSKGDERLFHVELHCVSVAGRTFSSFECLPNNWPAGERED